MQTSLRTQARVHYPTLSENKHKVLIITILFDAMRKKKENTFSKPRETFFDGNGTITMELIVTEYQEPKIQYNTIAEKEIGIHTSHGHKSVTSRDLQTICIRHNPTIMLIVGNLLDDQGSYKHTLRIF